ncbi:unnamed protein product [Merluccius merluccius]
MSSSALPQGSRRSLIWRTERAGARSPETGAQSPETETRSPGSGLRAPGSGAFPRLLGSPRRPARLTDRRTDRPTDR